MNKAELTAAVASETGLSQSAAGEALDATLKAIEGTLSRGGEVNITGFGKFSVAHRGARQGRNPATGETIQIGPSKSPKFSAGAKFKAAVKSSF
jgi:DNA-binding protein HU-beta